MGWCMTLDSWVDRVRPSQEVRFFGKVSKQLSNVWRIEAAKNHGKVDFSRAIYLRRVIALGTEHS
jgi:hypothetical protein